MKEKTLPVSVGEPEKAMILAICAMYKERQGMPVTQRAVVTYAIKRLHAEIVGKDEAV